MVHVCDSIMGSGKSQSAISYMNEHPDEKYIYITPYLDEAARIRDGCRSLDFIEPSDKLKQFKFKKTEHVAHLIKEGKNISTTHQAFKRYTPEMLEDIKANQYILMLDENVDVLEATQYRKDDIDAIINCGYLEGHNGVYKYTGKAYDGTLFKEIIDFVKSRDLLMVDTGNKEFFYYWILPHDIITSFKEVIVMTYLFEGQCLHHFFQMYNIEYDYIGIERDGDKYHFGPLPGYTPDYVYHIKDMIHIVDNDKANHVGERFSDLSKTWFDKRPEKVNLLKNNIYNTINYMWKGVPPSKKLWGTFKGKETALKGKGYSKSFLIFNSKATNEYRGRDHLVYAINVFMNVNEKSLYEASGVQVDEDLYALSVMVQWIWRSAIRDGKEIYIYIPSKRMRTLLINWMDNLSKSTENTNE